MKASAGSSHAHTHTPLTNDLGILLLCPLAPTTCLTIFDHLLLTITDIKVAHCHTTANWTFSNVFLRAVNYQRNTSLLLLTCIEAKAFHLQTRLPRRNFRTTKARGADATRHFVVTFPFRTFGTPNHTHLSNTGSSATGVSQVMLFGMRKNSVVLGPFWAHTPALSTLLRKKKKANRFTQHS